MNLPGDFGFVLKYFPSTSSFLSEITWDLQLKVRSQLCVGFPLWPSRRGSIPLLLWAGWRGFDPRHLLQSAFPFWWRNTGVPNHRQSSSDGRLLLNIDVTPNVLNASVCRYITTKCFCVYPSGISAFAKILEKFGQWGISFQIVSIVNNECIPGSESVHNGSALLQTWIENILTEYPSNKWPCQTVVLSTVDRLRSKILWNVLPCPSKPQPTKAAVFQDITALLPDEICHQVNWFQSKGQIGAVTAVTENKRYRNMAVNLVHLEFQSKLIGVQICLSMVFCNRLIWIWVVVKKGFLCHVGWMPSK